MAITTDRQNYLLGRVGLGFDMSAEKLTEEEQRLVDKLQNEIEGLRKRGREVVVPTEYPDA